MDGDDFLPTILISVFGILILKVLFETPMNGPAPLKTILSSMRIGLTQGRHFLVSLFLQSLRTLFKT